MNLRSIGLALGLAGLSITASSMSARALDFSFSFPVDMEVTTGSNITTSISSTTISGIIQGLQNNATGGATDVIITSDPVLGISSSTPLYYQSGTLTVVNGEITAVSNANFQNGNDDIVLNATNFVPPITYYNEIANGTTTAYASQPVSFITTNGTSVSSSFGFQQIPWEFNPGKMVGLGVPLMMGLRVLRKKLAFR
jgi:hypothetical protein